jgi:amidase
MTEIWQWNTATTTAHIASGEISATEVTQAHLDRLDAVNPALNAVTNDVREDAVAKAAALDTTFAATGPIGPLHGVPITIKENIDVAGQVTPNGMPVFADLVAPSDSPLVAHLHAAGAVTIGRTNTPEMSYRWHTDNPLRGETKNPWSSNRTPGGSSGGAAAAVVSGIGTIAHGNDLGGSLRQPANCNGLATIRPTLGRVPSHNASAASGRSLSLQLMSTQGPLAREVADVRLGLEVMAQPSPRDPWHRDVPIGGRPVDGPIRVAATYGAEDIPTQQPVRDAIDAAAKHLADAGYEVEFVEPPALNEIRFGWQSLLATETSVTVLDQLLAVGSEDFSRAVTWMFEDNVVLDLAGYIAAYTRRGEILAAWTKFLDQYPIVLTPVSQEVPFAPNADASSKERFHEILRGHTALVAVNYLGLPAAAVPTTLTDDGPIGVQLIGRPFREDICLDAAQAIETRVGVMAEHLWAR